MKKSSLVYLINVTLILSLFCVIKTALATCPQNLMRMSTNSIQSSFDGVLYTICRDAEILEDRLFISQSRAFIPLRDLLARRLVNKTDWDNWIKSGHTDVLNIYQPAPMVWENWVEAAKTIHVKSKNETDIISLDWLNHTFEKLSKSCISCTENVIRSGGVYGNCSQSSSALTLAQKNEIELNSGVLRFIRTKCWESLTPSEQAWNEQNLNACLSEPYYGVEGMTTDGKYCGYIVYPDQITSKRLLQNLITEVNDSWRQLQQNPSTIDPILLAAHAQKVFVTIHPFSDFNGRMSRFIMDRILTNLGLPPPILDNMDADLITSEREWAKQVGQGILNTLNGLRKCASYSNAPECQIVAAY